MQIHFDKVILPGGEIPVHAAGKKLAIILVGPVELYVQGPEDADRLIKAAVEAKELMLAAEADATRDQPASSDAAGVLAAAIAAGTPVVVTGNE